MVKVVDNNGFNNFDDFIKILNEFLKKSKVLKRISIEELYDEILWIKSCNFSIAV